MASHPECVMVNLGKHTIKQSMSRWSLAENDVIIHEDTNQLIIISVDFFNIVVKLSVLI